MKLREILKEEAGPFEKWLYSFEFEAFDDADQEVHDPKDVLKNDRLAPNITYLTFYSDTRNKKFDPPVTSDDWGGDLDKFTIAPKDPTNFTPDTYDFEIDSGRCFPNAQIIHLDSARCKTLTGIDKLSKTQILELAHVTFDKNILGLLKMPSLQDLDTGDIYIGGDSSRAFDIVMNAFYDKDDISDVVEKLHDEGLERFASF